MAPARPSCDGDPRLVIQPRPYDHPDVRRLVDELYVEQIGRYGFADAPNEDPTEFAPPLGVFLVAYADDIPCACGGMRFIMRLLLQSFFLVRKSSYKLSHRC